MKKYVYFELKYVNLLLCVEDFFFLYVSFIYLFRENGIDKNRLLKKDVLGSSVFIVFFGSFFFLKFKEVSLVGRSCFFFG